MSAADVFLSYSREDQPAARRFADALQREGFTVWWDQALNAGETFDQVTEQALKQARAVVVLWSKQSVTSRWVRSEATQADRFGTLVPVMIEQCDRPIMFELTHTADLSSWKGNQADGAWQSFVASVRRLVDGAGASDPRPPQAAANPAIPAAKRAIWQSPGVLAAAAALVLAGGGLYWWSARSPATGGASSAAASSEDLASVAVMPFSNLTGDAEKEYFSDGMAEQLINALSKVSGLKVASRTSSFSYKGKEASISQVGQELKVKTVLEGSVRSAGETVRITAQLIDASSGYNLWSESYDRKYADLFKLQDELTREIVAAFRKTLGAKVADYDSGGPPTDDLEAYNLYLQATAQVNKNTDAGARVAIELCDQVIARDPEFAEAYIVRAYGRAYDPTASLEQLEADVRKAVALNPVLFAEGQGLLAIAAARRGDWLVAEQLFDAVPSDSTDPAVHNNHALSTLWSTGRMAAARRELEVAVRLAPAQGGYLNSLNRLYSTQGLDKEALAGNEAAALFGAEESGRRFVQVQADAARRSGRYAEAADLTVSMLPPGVLANGGEAAIRDVFAAFGDAGRRASAVAGLSKRLSSLGPDDWVARVYSMYWFGQLGALDQAFEQAEKLRSQFEQAGRNPTNAWSWLWIPELRDFRRDARFQTLVTRLGMMDYWNRYGPPDGCSLESSKLRCN